MTSHTVKPPEATSTLLLAYILNPAPTISSEGLELIQLKLFSNNNYFESVDVQTSTNSFHPVGTEKKV